MDTDIQAVIELLTMLFSDVCFLALLLCLLVAAVVDCRERRIPNWLVLSGVLFGVGYNTLYPPELHSTILFPLAGLSVGLLLFLPLYLLRAMGAGDVKLLAMVGAFVGASEVLHIALWTVVCGGVLSILYVLLRGRAMTLWLNLSTVFKLSYLNLAAGSAPSLRVEQSASAGKLPYAVAIAGGTLGYLVLKQLGLI